MSKRSFPGRFRNYRLRAAARPDSLTTRKLRCERLEDRRLLAVVTVNTPNDVIDFNDGRTSLREAIYATNVVPGHDEIIFDFGHDGPETITLTEGQLEITDSLTITGAGASLFTIDASGNDPTPDEHNGDGSRVFRISSGRGPRVEVSISGVRLTGGDVAGSGGAIESFGSLALSNVEVVGNHATFDGGGLSLSGIATLDNTTVRNNQSGFNGGGIRVHSGANITIRNSTLSNNVAGRDGGGLFATRITTTEIYDSDVQSNVAANNGGGLSFFADTSVVSRTRIAGNTAHEGGGIYSRGKSLQIEDSAFIGNRATEAGGALRSNLSAVDVTGTLFMQNETTEDGSHGAGIAQLGGDLMIVDTLFLANLAYHKYADSPETGQSRGGALSISEANVTIQGGMFAGNDARTEGGAVWAHSATMRLSDVEFKLNKSNDGGAIVARNTDLAIEDSQFLSNSALGRGGAIMVDSSTSTSPPEVSSLRVRSSEFANNTAGFAGGAIAVLLYENVEIRQSLFRSNMAQSNQGGGGGGAIYGLSTSNVAISESVLQKNQSAGNGGALSLRGTTSLESSLITDNNSQSQGGGIYLAVESNHEVRIESTSLVRNHAGDDGGAIAANVALSNFSIVNSTISQNDAGDSGGGIYFALSGRSQGADFRIAHSTIAFNRAGQGATGGGVFAANRSQVSISHSIIYGNETDVDYQDIAAAGTGSFNIDYALIGGIAPGTPVTASHLLLGVNPQLQPLAPNGTNLVLPNQSRLLTHALSPNTPAVDAGDPNLMPGVDGTPEFDHRGAPFSRLAAGNVHPTDNPVIDLGAFEVQPARGALQADFDGDRRVSGYDFLIWQRSFGATNGATYATGDATGNGQVDGNDLAVWKATFGQALPKTENRRVAEQSNAEHARGAVLSAMKLAPNDLQTKRMASSRNARMERADARNDVAITHGLDHRQPTSYVSNVSNAPASRKAMIDVALEYSEQDETKFSELVDYIFDSHRTTIEKQVV